jgi:hypothetical protein
VKISNIRVYGIEESLVAMGYPMKAVIDDDIMDSVSPRDFDRGKRLGSTPVGTGHNVGLQGIIVQADFTMPSYWWPEAQRYHWFDFVSSQSKMHCIAGLWKAQKHRYSDEYIAAVDEAIGMYQVGDVDIEEVLEIIPMGLELTARMTTNYRSLKTMYSQRKHHRLKVWNTVFAEFVESLPYTRELGILGHSMPINGPVKAEGEPRRNNADNTDIKV